MKLRRISIENVRSFLKTQELRLDGDISIVIGPNGGGKTNLLDTAVLALRIHLLKSWMRRHNPTNDWQDRYDWTNNDALNPGLLEKHNGAPDRNQRIELDLEITQPDIDSILRAKAEAGKMQEQWKSRYTSFPASGAENWITDGLAAGTVVTFCIVNGGLEQPTSPVSETFRKYLETYEVNSRVRAEYSQQALSMPMISLPVNRSAQGVTSSIALANFNEYDLKRNVDAASSRAAGSIIHLAIGRLAGRYRDLLEEDTGDAKQRFKDDEAIKSFSRTLKELGYDWELKCTNTRTNEYDLHLTKQGSTFRASAASSGERELLTYLFAIYALNVRDALIVVDEPELHLHPRWQRTLLATFETLAKDTGNQFMMATHSPVFVSPSSIQYVSRVYSEGQQSRIVRLGDTDLPERKHLFSIVNSQNNERVFFADLVILVEGISDRVFFEALFKHFDVGTGTGKVYELISVGGKTLFAPYVKLLTACHVAHVIIADLDYVREVGTQELKALFTTASSSIKQNVTDGPTSIDGALLVERLDEAIKSGDTKDLDELWSYIKARHSRLKPNLTDSERSQLDTFIEEKRKEGCYILAKGALEAYLPQGNKSKDLEKLIRFIEEPDLWKRLDEPARTELDIIVKSITP
jgi:putative ATP-dependent endonuclease of OLD family